jgi:hypothetical protein
MTLLSEIERLATVYEIHAVIGICCLFLGFIGGFIYGDTRKRKS